MVLLFEGWVAPEYNVNTYLRAGYYVGCCVAILTLLTVFLVDCLSLSLSLSRLNTFNTVCKLINNLIYRGGVSVCGEVNRSFTKTSVLPFERAVKIRLYCFWFVKSAVNRGDTYHAYVLNY